jgi:PAS domain S-box-containing protein
MLMMNSVWRIVQRREADSRLLRLNKAIEQSPVSIVITDVNGNLEYVNPKYTDLTGYSFKEVLGKNPRILQSGETTDEMYQQMWKTIISGKEWHGEFLNKKKSGELFWENAIISPVVSKGGEITHFVGVKEDITEKKRMIDKLVEAKERAEESDKLKSSFLHNVSHEIRTPMNAIIGFADLLKEPDLDKEEIKKYSDIIINSSNQLLSIITDIVNVAEIESGHEKINEKETDLISICTQLKDQFLLKAKRQNVSLHLINSIPKEESLIFTDETKLIQVLANLLSNAIKFTKDGTVEFGCSVNHQFVEFYVRDTGIGIAPEKQKDIFKRFVQLDIKENRQYEGSGLGLAISKNYVELLGGSIWLKSSLGQGSTFYFTIPHKATNTLNK